MKYRNAQWNSTGGIDCEIDHPTYGWIPFTARDDDTEEHGREIFAKAQADAADYVPPDAATVLAEKRANMVCSKRQGKLALGPEKWAQVQALADDPEMPWGLKVAVHDAIEWHRTSEDMAALMWAMDINDEEADALFELAMSID